MTWHVWCWEVSARLERTRAVEVIERIGIGRNYLQDEHTLEHFREEIWSSKVLDHQVHASWVKGGAKTMGERCRERAIDTLQSHQPESVLDEKTVKELKIYCKKVDGT